MVRYIISEKALEELNQAADYYQANVDAECAKFFAVRFQETLNFICDYPNAWPLVRARIRRCSLKGFPYFVLYKVNPDSKITVISVLHDKSNHNFYRQ
jgi:plasmid stabilization system protein ParE